MNNMVTTILSRVIGGVLIEYLSDIFGVPTMLRLAGSGMAFIGVRVFSPVCYHLIEKKEG